MIGRISSHYLVNFFHTGDPNVRGLPCCRRHDPAAPETVDIGAEESAKTVVDY